MKKTAEPEYQLAPSYKRPTVQGIRAALVKAGVPIADADSRYNDHKARIRKTSYGDSPLKAEVHWCMPRSLDTLLLGKTYVDHRAVLMELRRILLEAGFRAVIHGRETWGSAGQELIVLSPDIDSDAHDYTDEEILVLCREKSIERLREKIAEKDALIERYIGPILKEKEALEAQLRELEQEG